MKAEDVDAALVEKAARIIANHLAPGAWTYPYAETLSRAVLAGVLPEIQAQAWEPVTEWANEWTQYLGGLGELTDFGKGMKAAVDQINRLHAARLTTTTEEPATCLPSLGEPCGSCHRCTEPQGGS